jgi:hypothetical protein
MRRMALVRSLLAFWALVGSAGLGQDVNSSWLYWKKCVRSALPAHWGIAAIRPERSPKGWTASEGGPGMAFDCMGRERVDGGRRLKSGQRVTYRTAFSVYIMPTNWEGSCPSAGFKSGKLIVTQASLRSRAVYLGHSRAGAHPAQVFLAVSGFGSWRTARRDLVKALHLQGHGSGPSFQQQE